MSTDEITVSIPSQKASVARSTQSTFLSRLKKHQLAIWFLTPSLTILGLLVGWPIIYSIYLGFNKVVIAGGKFTYDWVGLKNYYVLFTNPLFRQVVGQTVIYATAMVACTMLTSLILALLLNESVFGVELAKRIFLIPWAVSYTVNAVLWSWIFNGNFGVLNAILLKLGLISQYQAWLANPQQALVLIILANVWKSVPFAGLMILAALKTVDQDLVDAAKVDGAGSWACFTNVTLPCIKPILTVLLILETMWSLKSFDLIWVLTQGGPMNRTSVLNIFTYQETFQYFKFGTGSASALLISLATLILTILYFKRLQAFQE